MPGNWRPLGKLEENVMNWEENLILSLNHMNKMEKDDRKSFYVKYKLCKCDIYGLALVDTGNLEKSILVSSEFWEMIDGKMLEKSNVHEGTAEKGGKGLKVLGKGEKIKFYKDGLDQVFEVQPRLIEGLNPALQ